MNYKFIDNFHKSREAKIGASDIPYLIIHPTRQIESLAAYSDNKHIRHANTALDLYNEKINGKDFEYSFPADMGHYLEGKALFEFIADNIDREIASEFLRGYLLHKIEQDKSKNPVNPEPYNNTLFKHNTEAVNAYGVAHGDCLYVPKVFDDAKKQLEKMAGEKLKDKDLSYIGNLIIKKNNLIIDLSKPFLIEAKTANQYSVDARKKDIYSGYDLTLSTWQGIPLKVYFQIQYQMLLYNVDTCYVVLIFNTNSKHYWQIKSNKKHQSELEQIASYMKTCIDTKTPPKELIMNSKDIRNLYPEIDDNDFREIIGDELTEVLQIAKDELHASSQEKLWKQKKEDANERMAIHLKDTGILKGFVNGEIINIAKWKNTGGGERLMGLKEIAERRDSKKLLSYLRKNELIKESAGNKKPSVVIKEKDLI